MSDKRPSSLARGKWIEATHKNQQISQRPSSLARGKWIEASAQPMPSPSLPSLPSQEGSGLKRENLIDAGVEVPVFPRKREVD